jgi:hypothetical protein
MNHMATSIRPPPASLETPSEDSAPRSAVAQVLIALTSILYPEEEGAAVACAAATSQYDSTVAGGVELSGLYKLRAD